MADIKSPNCIRIPLHGPAITAVDPSKTTIENGIVHDGHKIDITTNANDEPIIVKMSKEPARRDTALATKMAIGDDAKRTGDSNGDAVIEMDVDECIDGHDEMPLNRSNKIKALHPTDGDDANERTVLWHHRKLANWPAIDFDSSIQRIITRCTSTLNGKVEIDTVTIPTQPPHDGIPADDDSIAYATLEAALSNSKETIV